MNEMSARQNMSDGQKAVLGTTVVDSYPMVNQLAKLSVLEKNAVMV